MNLYFGVFESTSFCSSIGILLRALLTTQQTHSWLLMNWWLWTHLFMIQSNLDTRILRKQVTQCKSHDKCARQHFIEWDQVYKFEWVPGTIESTAGLLSYIIKLVDGCVMKSHVDNIRICYTEALLMLSLILENWHPNQWSDTHPRLFLRILLHLQNSLVPEIKAPVVLKSPVLSIPFTKARAEAQLLRILTQLQYWGVPVVKGALLIAMNIKGYVTERLDIFLSLNLIDL